MKRFIRLVCLLVVFATLAAVPAYAQEQTARASAYLSSYRAYCTKNSSTSLSVSFQVMGTERMDEIGVTTVTVQYSTDQVNWTTHKTFSSSSNSSMIDTDTGYHAGVLTCTVPSGKYYRAKVTFYAAKGNGFAERYYTTGII